MLLNIVQIVFAFILLIWSADKFVAGASSIAKHLGVSSLVIGLTIVAFGTSAPEVFVSIMAAFKEKSNIAVGNAIGSNIANIGIVLGCTALIKPLNVHKSIILNELPILLFVTLTASALLWDQRLSTFNGSILLMLIFIIVIYITKKAIHDSKKNRNLKHSKNSKLKNESENENYNNNLEMEAEIPNLTITMSIFWLVVGLIILPLSSDLLVKNASAIALYLGISEFVVGLTIVAIGTSLPELATCIVGAIKGESDIVIGNIIGSNIFNLTAVLGPAGIIYPSKLPDSLITRDLPFMIILTIGLALMIYHFGTKGRINRIEGGLFLTSYLSYLAYIIYLS